MSCSLTTCQLCSLNSHIPSISLATHKLLLICFLGTVYTTAKANLTARYVLSLQCTKDDML